MKKPVVDYREFRLSRLNEPQFSHLKLLLGWVGFFISFILTEQLIPVERCIPVHCFIDDIVPFCEIFVIPYVGWYLLVAGSLLYFALYNIDSFKRLQIFIIVTQVVAMAVYILVPNCQNHRPAEFPRDNFLTDCIGLIYFLDTNTGVCPSLHCAYSIGIASVWLKEKAASKGFKLFIVLFAVSICLSTVFIKQHSALDFFFALPMCLLAEYISCGSYWKARFKRRKK
ncbi:MAG: phosphatidic acid phosphatase [Clostridia bacterium]|nr:phosphatidic acid phosphatase [Clostridia bacterium]